MTKGATVLMELLAEVGIRQVFGIPSGPWCPFMEAMRTGDVEFVLVSNEASAGFMADVCGRITGKPGACYGTFGPGATNLTTGVGCAYLDHSPLLAFTTEARDAMRQRTLQMWIDHQALFKPLTKWTTTLRPQNLRHDFARAVQVALSEVPGPVHLGLPEDLGYEDIASGTVAIPELLRPPLPDPQQMATIRTLIQNAQKPLLAVGLSVMRTGAWEPLRRFIEAQRLPVIFTPMAKGALDEDHPCYAGVLFHGLSDIVAQTNQQADLVIALGYDPVEFNYEDWMPNAPLVSIDTVPADIDRSAYQVACEVVCDLRSAIEQLAAFPTYANAWDLQALARRRAQMFAALTPEPSPFSPHHVLTIMRQLMPQDAILTCDVGAHTHLIGQLWRPYAPGNFIMTNGWSAMGFGIPAAMAAKLCRPERTVACVTGDGGFLMMVGEMATAARLGLPVVFVVLTDRNLQLIKIKQERKGYPQYGTALYTEAYRPAPQYFGVPVIAASDAKAFHEAFATALTMSEPVIVEALVDPNEYDTLILKPHR
ncbi:MAG TPA: thiamine pyrophosphate-binding protein [Alphaproteobacteria bacterium]|nr:thiamine pyrophosphate-binding protein [Alphaproteobacteria bacterium]